jgi:hypothetical protein
MRLRRLGLIAGCLWLLGGCGPTPTQAHSRWGSVVARRFVVTRVVLGQVASARPASAQAPSRLELTLAIPQVWRQAWSPQASLLVRIGEKTYPAQLTALDPVPTAVATGAPMLPVHTAVAVQLTVSVLPHALVVPAQAITSTPEGKPVVETPSGPVPVQVLAANPLAVAVAGDLRPGQRVWLPTPLGASALTPPSGLLP